MLRPQKFVILLAPLLLAASCNLPFFSKTSAGMLKTTNGGTDWQFVNRMRDPNQAPIGNASISNLAFDPKDRQHIFAGSYNQGLYLSEDNGATWGLILSRIGVYDFSVNPKDSKFIYAAGTFADHGRVLVTKDGGKSWNEVFIETSVGSPVRTIALNPDNAQEVVIGMDTGNILKSKDGGTSWRVVQKYEDKVKRIRWDKGALYALMKNRGLLKSTDGGETFVNITESLNKSDNVIGDVAIANPDIGAFNQFEIGNRNPSLIYMSADRGVYKTTDAGKNWVKLSLPIKDTAIIPFQAVAVGLSSDNVIYISALSTIYKSLDGGLSWQTQSIPINGLVNVILIDQNLPQIAYAGIFGQ